MKEFFSFSVEYIGFYAFYGCYELKYVNIHSIVDIKEGAFYGCFSIKELYPEIGTELIGIKKREELPPSMINELNIPENDKKNQLDDFNTDEDDFNIDEDNFYMEEDDTNFVGDEYLSMRHLELYRKKSGNCKSFYDLVYDELKKKDSKDSNDSSDE